MKQKNSTGTMAATISRPIATCGEVFPDGSLIELIGGDQPGTPGLWLWDGEKTITGTRVSHRGKTYEPARVDASIAQQLTLATRCRPHGTTREFLAEICKLVVNFAGANEKGAALTARIVLLSAIVDAFAVAPKLEIVGPDTARANRLLDLMRHLCRHSIPLTGVTPAGFCSLPNGMKFTFVISQTSVSDKLQNLLDNASSRDRRIPFRGRFLDLFGVQIIRSESIPVGNSRPFRSIQISVTPTGMQLPSFDQETQRKIASEFQDKLLSFRRANLGARGQLRFDVSRFDFALRDLASNIAAATPDDSELQAEVFELLREEDVESRSRNVDGFKCNRRRGHAHCLSRIARGCRICCRACEDRSGNFERARRETRGR
jgi:hypothetical protein